MISQLNISPWKYLLCVLIIIMIIVAASITLRGVWFSDLKMGKSEGHNSVLSKQNLTFLSHFHMLRMKLDIDLTCVMGKILL